MTGSFHRTYVPELVAFADVEVDEAFNARRWVSAEVLAELARDIERHGQLHPLVVLRCRPPSARRFFLVAGFRRQCAMVRLGWAQAMALVLPAETTMAQAKCINIAENAHGEPLHPSEIARRVVQLHEEHGMSFQAIALEVGKGDRYVRMLWRLVKELPSPVREAWYARHPQASLHTLQELVVRPDDASECWDHYVEGCRAAEGALVEVAGARWTRARTRKRPTPKQLRMGIDAFGRLPAKHPEAARMKAIAVRCMSWMATGEDAPEDVLGPLPCRVGRPPEHADRELDDGSSKGR